MSITRDVSTNEQNKFVESTAVPGQPVLPVANADGTPLSVSVSASDIQIGAVEIKNATDDTRATVRDLAANDALNVAIVDGAGDQITTFGGGTQYTEGATDATITGTVSMWEDAADTVVATSATNPFPVEIIAGAGSGGTAAADDADFTAGTTSGTPAQGVYESTPTTVTDGDLGTVGITSGRRLKTSATVDAALPAGTNAIGKLAANSGVDIGDVDVLSSALPTGASTSAKQDTVIGHLDGVETLLTTIAGDTTDIEAALETAGGLVVNLGANNDVTVTGAVDLGATDNAVLDAIAASTAAIETAVEGTLTVTGGGGGTEYTEDVATANPIVGTATMIERDDALSAVTPIEGDNIGLRGTAEGALWTQDFNSDAILADTTAVKAAVEILDNAISGSEMQVDVVTSALPTGASTLAEQQSQTTHLATVAGDTTSIQTAVELIDDTVATLGTTTYTEAATKGLIIGAVRRDADTTLADTTNEVTALQVDAAGRLKVEAFSGETLPVSLTSTTVTGTVAVTQSGTWDEVGINDSGNSITVDYATTGSGTATGALRVELPTNGTGVIATVGAVTAISNALPAGTNAIGKLAANTGVDIGDVDVTSVVPGTGATNLGKAEDAAHTTGDVGVMMMGVRNDAAASLSGTDGDYTPIKVSSMGHVKVVHENDNGDDLGYLGATGGGIAIQGDVSHDFADANAPAKIGGKAHSSTPTAVAANDRVNAYFDLRGRQHITPAIPEQDLATEATTHVKKYYTNAGAVTDGIIWSSAAGKRWYVTDIFINVSAAATVTLEDDLTAGDAAIWKAELAANSGWSHHFGTPLFSGEDAADLLVTTTAGNVYITVTGYEI